MSKKTLYRARRRHLLTGNVAKAKAIGRGRPRLLQEVDNSYMLSLARHKPSTFLDEYRKRLIEYRFIPAALSTLHYAFKRAGLSVKRVQKLARERSPQKRAAFIRRIGEYPPHYLVSVDEVSKDDRTYTRLWGRAPRGERVEVHAPFVRGRRLSMLAALALDQGIIASTVVEGSFNHDLFVKFLREDLVCNFLTLRQ